MTILLLLLILILILQNGSVVLRVPYDVMMSEEGALRCPSASLLDTERAAQVPMVALALQLLWEKNKQNSFFEPYIRMCWIINLFIALFYLFKIFVFRCYH